MDTLVTQSKSQAIILDLNKKFVLNLEKAGIVNVPILQARAVIDKSGSMSGLYESGWVSNVLNLFIGAALKFDDNGELEVGFFNDSFIQTPVATADDADTYFSTKARGLRADGGTHYAPFIAAFDNGLLAERQALADKAAGKRVQENAPATGGFFNKLVSSVFGSSKKEKDRVVEIDSPSSAVVGGIQLSTELQDGLRAYVGVITDGENSDDSEFVPLFQFILIGHGVHPKKLEKLAEKHKHIGVVHIKDPLSMTPDSFYQALCNEKFKAWI
jgi:hypothetical protein